MTATPPGKLRRTVRLVVGWAMLGAIVFWSYRFITAESRVREICAQIQPGMTLPSLRDFAVQHGMRKPTREAGTDFLVEKRSFGRYGCAVHLENGVVRAVEYSTSL